LVIARIGMDVPVRPVGYKKVKVHGKSEVVWDTLPDVACFHEASALPGHPGNTVINGHRDIDGSVFLRLNKVKVGDQIILYVGEVAYPYRVVEKRVTPYLDATAEQQAENLRLIGYMPEERLTLITCTPIGVASHRLYVIAKPPDSPPGSADPGAAIAR
jgi:sortase A